jgi:hypothetical protein
MMTKVFSGRALAVALGLLWLIDGLAQLQPKMFTSQFANNVVLTSASGQPHFLASLIHFFISIFLTHPAFFNSCILITQLGLAFLILYKRSSVLGLKLSILWALFVWTVGEGLGGLLGFNSNLLTGLPGAAILYAFLAVIAIIQLNKSEKENYKGYSSTFIWALVWILGGIYQLLPQQNSVGSFLSSTMPMKGQPVWLYSIHFHFSSWLSSLTSSSHMMNMNQTTGYWFILTLAIAEILIGISIFLPRKISMIFIWLGIAMSLAFWLIGQNLGGYYSGLATDPNTGPLLVLLGLVVLFAKDKDKYLKHIFRKIENIFI